MSTDDRSSDKAGTARFFIEHDVIHDRVTGKHVRSMPRAQMASNEDAIEECCALLNDLAVQAADNLALLARGVELFDPKTAPPIPMFLTCPKCNARHVDEGDFATKRHHTHSCQGCGLTWRPAVEATVGVAFLPGFKNEPEGSTLRTGIAPPTATPCDPSDDFGPCD